jgi:hypothetical protein
MVNRLSLPGQPGRDQALATAREALDYGRTVGLTAMRYLGCQDYHFYYRPIFIILSLF